MLFLTENYAALDILKNPKNYLSDKLSIGPVQEGSLNPSIRVDIQPFILFGSSFPKDREYTQVIFKFMSSILLHYDAFCVGVLYIGVPQYKPD